MSNVEQGISNYEVFKHLDILRFCGSKLITNGDQILDLRIGWMIGWIKCLNNLRKSAKSADGIEVSIL